jgi:N-acetylglucosamine-6-phosphate deacetylase
MIAFTSKVLYTPVEQIQRPVVLVEHGSIVKLSCRDGLEVPQAAQLLDFGECVIAPGMLDVHVHGSAGHDVMRADEGGREKFESFLARHGVTSYYPTTVAAPLDATLSALEHLADAIESSNENGRACPLGIHLEGPFLSHARRGVHLPEDLLVPDVRTFNRFWQAARGHIRIMTIAPELENAIDVISEAVKRGVCVSLGHSDADLGRSRDAISVGARHATHTFNAMRPLDHRRPGLLAEILTNENVTADVIADGIHVDPTMVHLLFNVKGPEKFVLITDAISAAGMPDGPYALGSLQIEVKDGRCTLNGTLAGSTLTLDAAVHNLMQFGHCNLQQALRTATMNPARVAGAPKKGVLEAGADADLVVLSPDGQVAATVIKGVVVHQ